MASHGIVNWGWLIRIGFVVKERLVLRQYVVALNLL